MTAFKLILLSLTLLTFNASSYTIFSSYGSCATWNKYTDNDKKETVTSGMWSSTLKSWLAGITTGINLATGEENFPNVDIQTMNEYIINYCNKNPKGDAYDAVLEIRKKIKK